MSTVSDVLMRWDPMRDNIREFILHTDGTYRAIHADGGFTWWTPLNLDEDDE